MENIEGSHFLNRMAAMLNKYHPCIYFRHDTQTIILADQKEFTSRILPRYFKHKNFKLFCNQLSKHGLKLTNYPSQRPNSDIGNTVRGQDGVPKLRQCMKHLKQLSVVNRITDKLRTALNDLPNDIENLGCGQLMEKLFQVKRLNQEYSKRIESYGRNIEYEFQRSKLQVQQDAESYSQWVIKGPQITRTEKIIRFSN